MIENNRSSQKNTKFGFIDGEAKTWMPIVLHNVLDSNQQSQPQLDPCFDGFANWYPIICAWVRLLFVTDRLSCCTYVWLRKNVANNAVTKIVLPHTS